ncbi:MAG TPA: bifunctional riboflavin kinase/FAD synthetase [Bacteroidia bacterium]|nr:bifunctional riboflavin kinase/FAD synthetase [Bacteroidia bacterium]
MKIYREIGSFKKVKKPVLTTGTFDGVHLGHKKIIERLSELAAISGGESVVLTFEPHPRMVLYPDDHSLRLLSTLDEKTELLRLAGVQHLIIYPFTKEFSRLSSLDFVRNILVNQIHTEKLVIGYNHHFGRNREGSFEHLKEFGPLYGFEVEEIPAQDIDHVEISSTKIRKALQEGDVSGANAYLGHTYTLEGTVIKGKQLGRTLGFPTANLDTEHPFKLIPADGIYAVQVEYQQTMYPGMMSIGMNPTVDGKNRTLEVNILNFDKDIYGEKLRIHFIKKMRDEVKFSGLEALKHQLELDRLETLNIFRIEVKPLPAR